VLLNYRERLRYGMEPHPAPGGTASEGAMQASPIPVSSETALKDLASARKAADAKALALLTPEHLRQWQRLQGRPFTFRTDP
jgi:hypothetical protein